MTQQVSPTAVALLRAQVTTWWQEHGPVLPPAAAEALALELSREVGQALLAAGLAQSTGKASYRGARVPCGECSGPARFVDYRERWLRTLCDDQRVSRAYYHCARCHEGQAPWDQEAGLDARIFSPAVKALVSECCARLTHQEVETVLQRTLGLPVEESSQQAVVGELGARLRAEEAAELRQCFETLDELPPDAGPPPERLYVGIDAAKAHIGGGWHDVKCAVFASGSPPGPARAGGTGTRKGTGPAPAERPGDRLGPKRYVARQEEAEAFGSRLYVAALRAGLAQAQAVVVLGDGADWIWKLAAEHFQGATEILDYYHAAGNIWKLVPVLYGEGSRPGKEWAEARCRDLREKGPAGLLRALARRKPKGEAAQEAVRLALGYFRTHRRRMDYPRFRKQGLLIGSGPVEAACKVVVGQRLKGAGMRWSTAGADAMLAVRTAVLNGQYDRIAQHARSA